NLLQQRLTRHRLLASPIEKAQDRSLLLGQTDLVALGVEQKLGARPKRKRPDGEDSILARLVLAQLGADARQEHRKPERLGDIVVGTGFKPKNWVGIGIMTGQ